MQTLADLLRDLRFGKTLREVEAATGISNAYLSQLESGTATQPSLRILKILSDFYGVSLSHLMQLAGYLSAPVEILPVSNMHADFEELKPWLQHTVGCGAYGGDIMDERCICGLRLRVHKIIVRESTESVEMAMQSARQARE